MALTLGILQGGGSLVGADLELLLSKNLGIQAGMGISSYGAGLNIHFKPNIRSSFISLAYWHQGFNDTHVQSAFGPSYVFRGKKWFTAQIGIGKTLTKGPSFPSNMKQPAVMLLYSIGGYIPW